MDVPRWGRVHLSFAINNVDGALPERSASNYMAAFVHACEMCLPASACKFVCGSLS